MSAPADDFAEIRDRLAIADLYARYALALDDVDLEMLAGCFAPDVEFVPGAPGIAPRTGIKPNQDRLVERHREKAFRERHMTNQPVVRRLDGHRAEAACEYVIFQLDVGSPPKLVSMGRYEDVLEKQNGRWVFTRRRAFRDQ